MLDAKTLPIQNLRVLSPEEFSKLVKKGVDLQARSKDASDAHKSSIPAMGKLVYCAREQMLEMQSDQQADGTPKRRQLRADMDLKEFWKRHVAQVVLNNHWYSCAVTFEDYVVKSGAITEADYDANTAQCLELTAAITKLVSRDFTHLSFLAAAHELRTRNNSKTEENSLTKLRAIHSELKGADEMTAEEARERLMQVLNANPTFLTDIVIPTVGAEIAHLADGEIACAAYLGLDTAISMFASNVTETGSRRFSDETIDGWLSAKAEASAPVKLFHVGPPV